MMFKTNWAAGELGHAAVHNDIGAALNGIVALLPTGGDDSTMIQAALNAYHVVTLGPGVFACSSVTIPSHRKMIGSGYATQIHNSTARDGDPNIIIPWALPEVFQMADGTYDVIIQDMAFTGEHVTGWTEAQMASIGIRGSTSHDISIEHCLFEDLVGFSVHNEGSGENISVTDCTFRNCGNGLNVNAKFVELSRNFFYHSEGIEASGTGVIISDNWFYDAINSAISIGGNQSQNYTENGSRVINNTINGVVRSGSSGIGIVIAESVGDLLISGNSIDRVGGDSGIGIDLPGFRTGLVARNVSIDYNTVSGCAYGIMVAQNSGLENISITGNRIGLRSNSAVTIGIIVNSPDIYITGNRSRGSLYDVALQSNATDTKMWHNDYRSDHLYLEAGATIAQEP